MRPAVEHGQHVEMDGGDQPGTASPSRSNARSSGYPRPAFGREPGNGAIKVSDEKRARLFRMNGVTCSRSLGRVASLGGRKERQPSDLAIKSSGHVGGSTFEA